MSTVLTGLQNGVTLVILGILVGSIIMYIFTLIEKKNGYEINKYGKLLILLSIVYFYAVIGLTSGSAGLYRFSYNNLSEGLSYTEFTLRPLDMIGGLLSIMYGVHDFINVVGNMVFFIPIGIITYLLLKRDSKKQLYGYGFLAGLLTSLIIETFQVFELRGADVNDVFLNTIGSIIGISISLKYIKIVDYKKEIDLKHINNIKVLEFVLLIFVVAISFVFFKQYDTFMWRYIIPDKFNQMY